MNHKLLVFVSLFLILLLGIFVSSQIDGIQCNSANNGRHFPSGFNCTSYYTCFNGNFYLQNCPSPFHFNFQLQACDLPENVNCDLDGTTAPTPPIVQTTTTSTTVAIPTECPSSGILKLPNPKSCTLYSLCFSGTIVEQSCSPGLFFSRSQLRCVRREDSDCEWNTNICPTENDPNNIVFLPNIEDCQKYYICYNGSPQEFDCGPSLHWDPSQNWCIREEDSSCKPTYILPDIREIECPESSRTELLFLPHPQNCQFYFICYNMQSHIMRCSSSLLFDYVRGYCNFRDQANCFTQIK
ncbi:hypothetical protein PVAND_008265 [Polypedilum vanderplanki]|uniref:Chitin-binding type-2 domain-containing protein n=1 Tax=Polypedilum vanderplanki TaxID=319348 RepID=A0A9J6C8X7_POLVA|nr:hypothetical protein PVAND_008265 [Polypedilum vanderplanki]